MSGIANQEVEPMKPAAVPDTAGVPTAPPPGDEAQKRAIAVWTDRPHRHRP